MRDVLVVIRRLALGSVVLSALAVPLGALLLVTRSSDGGGNALGDLIAYGLGLGLVVIGGAALILGSALAILAKRSISTPAELHGSHRTALAVGLTVAGAQVLISVALGAMFSLFVGLSAAFAAAYLVVAAALPPPRLSRTRGRPRRRAPRRRVDPTLGTGVAERRHWPPDGTRRVAPGRHVGGDRCGRRRRPRRVGRRGARGEGDQPRDSLVVLETCQMR